MENFLKLQSKSQTPLTNALLRTILTLVLDDIVNEGALIIKQVHITLQLQLVISQSHRKEQDARLDSTETW